MDLEDSRRRVAALTAPKNVVLVGASDRPGSWAARVWRNLGRYGFEGNIYPVNPGRNEVFGRTCWRDVAALPEPPDHLVVLAPAAGVADVLTAGAAAGARSATVFSAGFGEAYDAAGAALGRALADTIRATGLGVSGPNCMGNICGPARLVSLTEDRELTAAPGPVALVGQSGGVMIFTNRVLEERGIRAGYLITSGNELGLTVADYIAYFCTRPEIKAIVAYIEAVRDEDAFRTACAAARAAGTAVIALKLGQSPAGQEAALAHTGRRSGPMEDFDALAAECGVIRADTLDDVVETVELVVHGGVPRGRRLAAITMSGACRGLLLDAAARHGLLFPELAPETLAKLHARLSVGSLVGNPLDGGFGILTSQDNFAACVAAVESDPNIDMVLLQEELPRGPGSARTESYLRLVEDYARSRAGKPIAFITLLTHSHNDYSRALRADLPHLAFLEEANKGLRAIDAALRRNEAAPPARR
jgi:acetyltransferase